MLPVFGATQLGAGPYLSATGLGPASFRLADHPRVNFEVSSSVATAFRPTAASVAGRAHSLKRPAPP